MSSYSSVYTDLDDIQLKMELQPKTPKIVSTSGVMYVYGDYSEVELVESMVGVATKFNKVCIWSLNKIWMQWQFCFIYGKEGYVGKSLWSS